MNSAHSTVSTKSTMMLGAVGGAVGGIVSKVVQGIMSMASKAMAVVGDLAKESFQKAESLNRIPKIFQQLGASAEDSERAVQKISDGLVGVTGSASDVGNIAAQIFPAFEGDLDGAANAALNMNNMVHSMGAPIEEAESAMIQFRQAVVRGKFEQEEWNSLMNVASGQLNNMAKEMLGADANASTLKQAMTTGKISMKQFTDQMQKDSGKIKSAAETAGGGITNMVQNLKGMTTSKMADIWKPLLNNKAIKEFETMFRNMIKGIDFKDIGVKFNNVVSQMWNSFKGMIPQIKQFSHQIGDFFTRAGNLIKNVWTTIQPVVQPVFNFIATILPPIWNNLMKLVQGVMDLANGVAQFLAPAFKIIGEIASPILQGIAEIFKMIIGFIGNVGEHLSLAGQKFSELGGKAQQVMQQVAQWFQDLPNQIMQLFSNAGNWLVNAGRDMINGMINGVKSAVGGLVDAAKGAVSGAINAAKSAIGLSEGYEDGLAYGQALAEGMNTGVTSSGAMTMSLQTMGDQMVSTQLQQLNNQVQSLQNNLGSIISLNTPTIGSLEFGRMVKHYA